MIADAILADLDSAADATDLEEIAAAVSRAFAGILRIDGEDQVSEAVVSGILKPFWLVEAAAREALPTWYWHERGQHGFHCAFALLRAWEKPPGSPERRDIGKPGIELIVRIVANDLDSLVAAFAFQRVGPAFPPLSVLMPVQHVTAH